MPQLKSLMKRDVQARDVCLCVGPPADILVDPTQHRVSLIVDYGGSNPGTLRGDSRWSCGEFRCGCTLYREPFGHSPRHSRSGPAAGT